MAPAALSCVLMYALLIPSIPVPVARSSATGAWAAVPPARQPDRPCAQGVRQMAAFAHPPPKLALRILWGTATTADNGARCLQAGLLGAPHLAMLGRGLVQLRARGRAHARVSATQTDTHRADAFGEAVELKHAAVKNIPQLRAAALLLHHR